MKGIHIYSRYPLTGAAFTEYKEMLSVFVLNARGNECDWTYSARSIDGGKGVGSIVSSDYIH